MRRRFFQARRRLRGARHITLIARFDFAESDPITRAQLHARDRLSVDQCAVRGIEVFEITVLAYEHQLGVPARYRDVPQANGVLRRTPNGNGLITQIVRSGLAGI